MISRYKWYKVRLPGSIDAVFTKLREAGYEPDSATGFLVDESAESFRYIWPSTISAIHVDSEGNTEYRQVATVNSQSVTVIAGPFIIFRFENPARSLREILNALEKSVGFGFACEQIVIRDELVRVALEGFSTRKLTSLKLSGVIPSARALARLDLVSKEGIDPASISLIDVANFTVDAASYEVTYNMIKGQIGFTRSGACKISGMLTPLILGKIEEAVLNNC
ncbi:hypothetical protein EF096_20320 [Pseudomonas neustonica]|uniref:Uncharacterized protein n=1 Tax=Pseudomonas neustonica TaxID=2487346 RepID=A0ABX9XE84_9PSED|nr:MULTISPECIES: hypothetical protein [Pseudomonas]ROZ75859.1 hypothetical protein EF099_20315 [Pseudomonas sp. SSM44]ROZ79923.1 hypothetical protein EF096_20320 [Pseudomonas neustonica]